MELYYFLSIILVASILQAVTGFGGALVAAPLLLLFFDKTTSVVSLAFVSIVISALLLYSIRRPINRKTFYDLFIPSLIGLPIGLLILNNFSSGDLRIFVGGLALIFAILLFSKSITIQSSKLRRMFAGFFSGVLRTSVGLNSPPVVLLLASENTDKDEMRKTLAFLFFWMSALSVVLFFFTDHLTGTVWRYALWSIPAALLGGWIGNAISKKVSQKGFIISVLVLITASLLVAVFSSIKSW
ncbi:MAG: sulfite exporter TauE/SafE family protein [bacterium]|nr:sulfite exporter TauE/SafE family protein [bacterium]